MVFMYSGFHVQDLRFSPRNLQVKAVVRDQHGGIDAFWGGRCQTNLGSGSRAQDNSMLCYILQVHFQQKKWEITPMQLSPISCERNITGIGTPPILLMIKGQQESHAPFLPEQPCLGERKEPCSGRQEQQLKYPWKPRVQGPMNT